MEILSPANKLIIAYMKTFEREASQMDGVKVDAFPVNLGNDVVMQALPAENLKRHSPFILLHHFGPKSVNTDLENLRVPPHPHRGFSPVTFVISGRIRHRDSLGNDSTIGTGGIQWIRAGKGIIHSEETDPDFILEGGKLEIIQLWINLPAHKKLSKASYQAFEWKDIPQPSIDGQGTLGIYCGTMDQFTGPITPDSAVNASIWKADKEHSKDIPVPKSHNVFIYQLKGETSINEKDIIGQYQGIALGSRISKVNITSRKDNSILLFLTGAPIDEPMAQYGPFVMNTQTEILEALRDYQTGKMGILID